MVKELAVGQALHPSMNDATAHHVKGGEGPCQNVEQVTK